MAGDVRATRRARRRPGDRGGGTAVPRRARREAGEARRVAAPESGGRPGRGLRPGRRRPRGNATRTPWPRPSRSPVARTAAARPREPPGPRPPGPSESSAPRPKTWSTRSGTRAAEWGPNLMVVGAWVFAMAMLVYFLMGWLPYGLTFLLLLVGAVGAVRAELPDPDHAGAAGPDDARAGRARLLRRVCRTTCPTTGGCGCSSPGPGGPPPPTARSRGSRPYWAEKLRTIKGEPRRYDDPAGLRGRELPRREERAASRASTSSSPSRSLSAASGRPGPIASIPGQMSLVRGPDKMWYLESGTLPEPARRPAPSEAPPPHRTRGVSRITRHDRHDRRTSSRRPPRDRRVC